MDNDIYSYRLRVEAAVAHLAERVGDPPEITIILGTGLGDLGDRIEPSLIIPYREIPGFPWTTVAGHAGNLLIGRLAGRAVAVLQGRFHYYEGYSARELTLPVRVMALLGAGVLVVTNVAGGLNLDFAPGSLMIIRDHLNLIPDNPLRGINIDEWGLRFPDLSAAYDEDLRKLAGRVAGKLGLADVVTGIYGAIPGPSLETPAETRYLRHCGIDAVGMSTTPEVIVANHASMRVLGVSVIANVNDPDDFQPIRLEDVITNSRLALPRLADFLTGIVAEI
ncbi:MAG: purine-nucleoside phosphorylase [Desulfurivibrionaceae bacterium]|nr:purine-nucleoside phosphorylase [Desulfobulbales bacterium]MDT8336012.1 purine-nucleoside phosphorylase [Desulfurivibrionaceae bacterium]